MNLYNYSIESLSRNNLLKFLFLTGTNLSENTIQFFMRQRYTATVFHLTDWKTSLKKI